jgi:di/tricarboxylate transporter
MDDLLWWGKQIAIGCVAVIFLVTGINVLVASYSLTNPLEFIMYFFSSSMLILVSIVFLIYPAVRIYGRLRGESPEAQDENNS